MNWSPIEEDSTLLSVEALPDVVLTAACKSHLLFPVCGKKFIIQPNLCGILFSNTIGIVYGTDASDSRMLWAKYPQLNLQTDMKENY